MKCPCNMCQRGLRPKLIEMSLESFDQIWEASLILNLEKLGPMDDFDED